MKNFYLLFIVPFFLFTETRAAIKYWVGNNSSNWNVSANWNPPGSPSTGDHIIINQANYTGSKADPVANSDYSISHLDIIGGAKLTMNGGNFTLTGNLTLNGNSSSSPIFILNSGTLKVQGTSNWLGHASSQPKFLQNGGVANFMGIVSSTLNAAKVFFELNAGEVNFYANLSFRNSIDQLLQNGGRVLFHNTSTFLNSGLFNAIAGETLINGNNTFSGTGSWQFFTLVINPGKTLIQASNTINLAKDWVNYGSYTHNNKLLRFNGSTFQLIKGSLVQVFYGLEIANSSGTVPQLASESDILVENQLSMESGCVNLNGNNITLGVSETVNGTLNYNSGWFYGGGFKRWFTRFQWNNILLQNGHFPVGSHLDYRPFWFRVTNSSSSGGSITVSHHADYPAWHTLAYHLDPSWGDFPGTMVEGVSNSYWEVVHTGFGSGRFEIRYGGYGFGIFDPEVLNSTLFESVVGNHVAATSELVPLEVNRSALFFNQISNLFYIGTRNVNISPLPVKLSSFTANSDANGVKVSWATESEINSDYFIVEKSSNAKDFLEAGKIKAAGNSTVPLTYSLSDEIPFAGTSYYRLKTVDFDGTYELSEAIVVTFHKDEGKLLFSPNPIAPGQGLHISGFDGKNEDFELIFMDISGKVHYQEAVKMASSREIRTEGFSSQLSPGIYFLRIISGHYNSAHKIIIH